MLITNISVTQTVHQAFWNHRRRGRRRDYRLRIRILTLSRAGDPEEQGVGLDHVAVTLPEVLVGDGDPLTFGLGVGRIDGDLDFTQTDLVDRRRYVLGINVMIRFKKFSINIC